MTVISTAQPDRRAEAQARLKREAEEGLVIRRKLRHPKLWRIIETALKWLGNRLRRKHKGGVS